jgi:hypothetical protein
MYQLSSGWTGLRADHLATWKVLTPSALYWLRLRFLRLFRYKRSNVDGHRSGSARRAALHSQGGSRGSSWTHTPRPRESNSPNRTQIGTDGEERCGYDRPRSPGFINMANNPGRGKEMVYCGDSFNLNYVLREMGNPFQGAFDSSTLKLSIEESYLKRLGQPTKDQLDAHERSERLRLQEIGAFQRLDKEISDALLRRSSL